MLIVNLCELVLTTHTYIMSPFFPRSTHIILFRKKNKHLLCWRHAIHWWKKNFILVEIDLFNTYCGRVKRRECSVAWSGSWLLQIVAQGRDGSHSILSIHSRGLFRSIKPKQKFFPTPTWIERHQRTNNSWKSGTEIGNDFLLCISVKSFYLLTMIHRTMFWFFLYRLLSTSVTTMFLLWHLQKLVYPTLQISYVTTCSFKSYFCLMVIRTFVMANISRKRSCLITGSFWDGTVQRIVLVLDPFKTLQ